MRKQGCSTIPVTIIGLHLLTSFNSSWSRISRIRTGWASLILPETSPVANQPHNDQTCQQLSPTILLTNISNQIHLAEQMLIPVMFVIEPYPVLDGQMHCYLTCHPFTIAEGGAVTFFALPTSDPL